MREISIWFKRYTIENPFVLLLIIFTLNLILKFKGISLQSFWLDELETMRFSEADNFIIFLTNYFKNPDYHPPLYYLLINIISGVFGSEEVFIRGLSALMSSLVIFPLYFLGIKVTKSSSATWLSLWFYTLSGANLYYAQEARSYGLILFLGISTYYFGMRLADSNKELTKLGAYFTLLGTLFLYSGYIAIPFYLILFPILFIRQKENWKMISTTYLISIILFSPWLLKFFEQMGSWSISKPYNQDPNLYIYLKKMVVFSFFYIPYWQLNFNFLNPIRFETIIFLLSFLLVFVFLIMNAKEIKGSFKSLSAGPAIPIALISTALIGVWLKDFVSVHKFFYERNLLFLTPFFYLLAGQMIVSLKNKVWTWSSVVLITALMIFQPFINQNYYGEHFKTDYRGFSKILDQHQSKFSMPLFFLCGNEIHYSFYMKERENVKFYDGRDMMLFKNQLTTIPDKIIGVVYNECLPQREVAQFIQENFKEVQNYETFGNSGFNVLVRKE